MVGKSLFLYPATKLKRLASNFPCSASGIRRYKHGQAIDEERAPSMEEEFKRVAEEKSRQGFSSQTVEKARDGAEEATVGSSKLENVKEAYQESPHEKTDFHKSGDKE